jgi:hypothetical protein
VPGATDCRPSFVYWQLLLFSKFNCTTELEQDFTSKMAPPSANELDRHESPSTLPTEGVTKDKRNYKLAIPNEMPLPEPYIAQEDPYKEREYQKGRLALAFRIFAKLGFDEGIAGHITYRVSIPHVRRL